PAPGTNFKQQSLDESRGFVVSVMPHFLPHFCSLSQLTCDHSTSALNRTNIPLKYIFLII
ncbi:hypothetical protein, partial [Photobacterium ganghwense]|uniref:hypothetical protein n=1 Tax=Photobacterium ganghwense TaxID=320778 RepID=UPI001C2D3E2C